jgi:hypothetical protein
MISLPLSGVSTRYERALLHRLAYSRHGRRSCSVVEHLVMLVLRERPGATLGQIMELLCADVNELKEAPIRTGHVARVLQSMLAARVVVASVDEAKIRYTLRKPKR